MICEKCGNGHDGTYGSGRFCNSNCARSFSSQEKRQEINEKVSITLKETLRVRGPISYRKGFKHTEETKRKIGLGVSLKSKGVPKPPLSEERKKKISISIRENYIQPLTSILQLSSRTVSKILRRMGIGCSRCGWNLTSCDIHHIYGRKIEDAQDHKNLSYLCPNCHRLANFKLIAPEELICLVDQVGEEWKDHYYGLFGDVKLIEDRCPSQVKGDGL